MDNFSAFRPIYSTLRFHVSTLEACNDDDRDTRIHSLETWLTSRRNAASAEERAKTGCKDLVSVLDQEFLEQTFDFLFRFLDKCKQPPLPDPQRSDDNSSVDENEQESEENREGGDRTDDTVYGNSHDDVEEEMAVLPGDSEGGEGVHLLAKHLISGDSSFGLSHQPI